MDDFQDAERLKIEPQAKPKYTLDELLAQHDAAIVPASTDEDRAWFDLAPMGREI